MNRRSTVERRKLVYVMGAGHSGSTILGITLGNCDGFFYAGELEEWPITASRPRWGASDRQEFWDAVKDRVHEVAEIRWRRRTMSATLWIPHRGALRTFLSHPEDRRMLVRHEDFRDDPAGVTRQILGLLGSDSELPDFRALAVGAPLEGNQPI